MAAMYELTPTYEWLPLESVYSAEILLLIATDPDGYIPKIFRSQQSVMGLNLGSQWGMPRGVSRGRVQVLVAGTLPELEQYVAVTMAGIRSQLAEILDTNSANQAACDRLNGAQAPV